jgi:hypothetical protein
MATNIHAFSIHLQIYDHRLCNLAYRCWKTTLVNAQHDAKKTKFHMKASASNMQSNGQPFKSWVFCKVPWELNSGIEGLVIIVGIMLCNKDQQDALLSLNLLQ